MNRFIAIFCFTAMFFSCSKTSNTSTAGTAFFPQVPVNITIQLSGPAYAALTFQQGWVYEPGGYKGIIIYHTINDVYVAYDRTCPVNPMDTCAYVSMDSSLVYFSCSKKHIIGPICTSTNAGICESTFIPDNGFPRSGNAKVPLKQYTVVYDGTNYLHITGN